MSDDEADELLSNNSWTKWSEARELLQMVWNMGYVAAKAALASELFPKDKTNE